MKEMEISEPEIPLSTVSESSTIAPSPQVLVEEVVEVPKQKAATKTNGPSGSKKEKQNGRFQRKTKKEVR